MTGGEISMSFHTGNTAAFAITQWREKSWDVPSSMIVAITIKTRDTFNAYSVLSEHSYRSCLLELLKNS